jgi:uncharacterized protein (DUF1800 family)
MQPVTYRSRAARLLCAASLCAAAAGVARAQATPAEISTAAHVVRRVELGASLGEIAALTPTTGGPTQAQLIANYITAQIARTAPQSSELNWLLTGFTVPPRGSFVGTPPTQPATWTIDDLADLNVARALWSAHSLEEKMTQFWQRHFNTNYWKLYFYFWSKFAAPPYNLNYPFREQYAQNYAVYFETKQNDLFRVNAFGNFRTLLGISAKGETMMVYLDSAVSQAPKPNENFARELLELHTLGQSGFHQLSGGAWTKSPNYDYADVISAAAMLSGWTLKDVNAAGWPFQQPKFEFNFLPTVCTGAPLVNSSGHVGACTGSPPPYNLFSATYLNPNVAASWLPVPRDTATESEGELLLDFLAMSPVTAEHISRKLYTLFVSEIEPPGGDPVIAACVAAWATSNGNIGTVLQTLLNSTRFVGDLSIRWDLPRTPLEILGQQVDLLNGTTIVPTKPVAVSIGRVRDLRARQEEYFGEYLFKHPSPDGYIIDSHRLLSTTPLLGATRLRQTVYAQHALSMSNFTNTVWGNGVLGYAFAATLLNLGVNVMSETDLANYMNLVGFANELPTADRQVLIDQLASDNTGALGGAVPTLMQIFLSPTGTDNYFDRLTGGLALASGHSLSNLK